MKGVLIFSLPREEREYLMASHASDMVSALGEMYEHLRARLKYGELGEQARGELEEARRVLVASCEGLPETVQPW